jgi:hypothetical protein
MYSHFAKDPENMYEGYNNQKVSLIIIHWIGWVLDRLFGYMLLAYREQDSEYARQLTATYRRAMAEFCGQADVLGLFRFFYLEAKDLFADGRTVGLDPIFWSTWRSFLYKRRSLVYFVFAKAMLIVTILVVILCLKL